MSFRPSCREEEVLLLDFVIDEAKHNKALIEALENFEVEVKPNGVIHKTKENARKSLISRLKKENSTYKKFYQSHLKKDNSPHHKSRYMNKPLENIDHLKDKFGTD